MDSLKPESESDSTFTGSDEDALSGVSTMDLLEWLKSLSKLCPHVFDISLCILPIDKTLKEKLVEIFVDFIAKQQNYRERTREITKGWDKTEQLVNALGLLKTFTLKNIREWKQSNRDEIQRSINRTSSAQRKMLRQSLGNALKEEKGGSFFLPGDKFFFQEKSLKNPQEILEMEADLQKNAIEILPNCEKRILTLIKDELATMFPGLDNFRNELIDLFGRHPAEEIDIKTLLKAKFKSELRFLFDVLHRIIGSKTSLSGMENSEPLVAAFKAAYEQIGQFKSWLEEQAGKMLSSDHTTYLVEKLLDQGKTKDDANTIVTGLLKDFNKRDETEEVLTTFAEISKSGTQGRNEAEFLEKWNEYEKAHQDAKENAILILSSCDSKLHEDLSKNLDKTITITGKAIKRFQNFFTEPHEITPHSVEKLLMEEDEKDEFYEALFAVLYQPASKDKEIERSLQVARQSACKDGEKKLPQCARQYKKAVESCLSETLLHCDEAFLELFINELKTHAISKAIFAVPFTTRSANSTAMKREKVTSKQ
ncbi:uncharacterized protein [Watersipora subatra]|uniref:uncharacterized protein isoform X1 n=1 Tax=Watersipora subatra TaxID=2589382 RepID=UPI00355C28B5